MSIAHGVGGWLLEDMDWDPDTGVATFLYSNSRLGVTQSVQRRQPAYPRHDGWQDREQVN